jgi:peptide/nickel transport system substrate-binding protein
MSGLHVRRRGRLLTAVGAAFALLALAGCGGGSTGSQSATGPVAANAVDTLATGVPKPGGTLVMVGRGLNTRIDPALQLPFFFTESPLVSAIFGQLAYLDSTDGQIKMGFLKSMTPSADNKVWTLVLTPGLKFSDGTSFDSAAIAFNIARMADPATGSPVQSLAASIKTDVVDPTTLTLTLAEPNAAFASVFVGSFASVGSPTAIRQQGASYSANPIGAGPFKIKSINQGSSVTLVRNDYYGLFRQGQPYLDQITMQSLDGYDQVIAALSSGTAQMALVSGAQYSNRLGTLGLPALVRQIGGGGNFLMNNAKAPFDDPIARQAVTLALDRTSAANAYAPETPPQETLFPPDSPYYDPKYALPGQNRDEAQKLFDQLAAAGKPVSFTYLVPASAEPVVAANYVQSQLSAFKNVTVKIESVPNPVYLTRKRQSDFQMTPGGLYMVNPVPDMSDFFTSQSAANVIKWDNPAVDAAFAQIKLTTDPAKLKELYGTIQAEFLKDEPMYPTTQNVVGVGTTKNVTGVHLINLGFVPLWGELGFDG